MRKLKIKLFQYKRYNQIYVEQVLFHSGYLVRLLDYIPTQRIIMFFETTLDIRPVVSKLKDLGVIINYPNATSITEAFCEVKRSNLSSVIGCIKDYQVEDFYVATIQSGEQIDIQNPKKSKEYYASIGKMVEKGIADFSAFINVPESEWIVSVNSAIFDAHTIKAIVKQVFCGTGDG